MKLIRRLNNRHLNADAEFVEVTDWESAFKYGYAKLQQVFGDRFDQSIADATLNGLKDKYPDNPKVVIGALKYGHQSKDEDKNSRLIRNYIINSRRYNSSRSMNSVRIKPEGITVVSIKDLLEDYDGRRFLGLYPKLSRIIAVLIEASHSEGILAGGKLNIPNDIYLVNYKLPKRFANELVDLFSKYDYTDIYNEDYSVKMKDTLCSTQGIFFKGVDSNTFSKIVLNKYSMPDLNVPETYMDINPLTLGDGGDNPGPKPETYDTIVSRHVYDYPTEIHEPKVTVKLPIDPKISLI